MTPMGLDQRCGASRAQDRKASCLKKVAP
jgi:hypothetical protein